jgi:hypothetical protein
VARGRKEHGAGVAVYRDRVRLGLVLGGIQHDSGVGRDCDQVTEEAGCHLTFRYRRGRGRLVRAEKLQFRMTPAEASQQRTVDGSVQLSRFALQLGAKANGRAAHELSDGASGIHRIECPVGAQCGEPDVLEVGADPAGIEIEGDDVVLPIESEYQSLLGVRTHGSCNGRKGIGRLPGRRVEGGYPVQPGEPAVTRDSERSDAGNGA